MNFEFEKGGFKFCFRNPIWNKLNMQLNFEWKIEGVKENTSNDGYFYRGSFSPERKSMNISFKLNGKEYYGVGLPEDIFEKVNALYEEKKLEDYLKKLNSDIKYTLNDMTSYGIYNGISEFDIETLVFDIKAKFDCDFFLISAKEVAQILNQDKELKEIALETYRPFPEDKKWREEYLDWFREAAEEKKAPGYGIIPNHIIKEKITNIILDKMTEENELKEKEKERFNELLAKAKETGEPQLIAKWMDNCNDPKEECNFDICNKWVMPDGTTKITREHTW